MAREDLNIDHNVYDVDQVYTGGAKDSQGHSTNIRATIPDNWVGIIAQLISSDDWPEFTTPQQFYRDAIYHRMRWAGGDRRVTPRMKSLIAIAQAEAAMNHAALLRTSSQRIVDQSRSTLADLLGDGNTVAVRETLKELEAVSDSIEEPWRTELRREITNAERRMTGI